MSANTEKCADKDKAVCDYNEFRRLRYFHGMLLDDKDFRAEQQYHAGKRRLLNRMLHGSGVVCGLDLKSKKDARWIEVTSGFALDCSGNEIWVNKTQRVDLASLLPPKDKPKKAECRDDADQGDVKTYYIGIRYEEKPTDPVSVYLPSATCEERTCENSRYKEGFCIEVVDCCPDVVKPGLLKRLCDCETGKAEPDPLGDLCGKCGEMPKKDTTGHGNPANERDRMETWCKCVQLEEFCESSVECPECCSCDKPCYVVLGQIKVRDCKIVSVCMNECRRYVLTGRMVQHMLLGVFGGSEEYFYANVNGTEAPLPNVGEMVNNPMVALCWYLENRLLKRGSIVRRECTDQKSEPGPKPEDEIRTIARDIEALSNRQTVLARRLGIDAIPFERSEAAKNLGVVETATAAGKETTDQTTDKTTDKTTSSKLPKK